MIDRVLSGDERWAIVCGDNIEVMRTMPPGRIHLVYGDAPYNTGRDFTTDDGRLAYSDRFPSIEAFVENIRERCAVARDLLTDDGTLVIQVDPETSHYVKVMLDSVFGRACYRNEIVWRYRRWPSPSKDFQRMHDIIFRYTRTPGRERWTQLYEPLSPATIAAHGTKKQRCTWNSEARKPVGKGHRDEESPGAYLSDVWDISRISPVARDRTGYPTEKPRALAERVISACSLPGDIVLDPWSGSATHISAAVALGRRGIGLDSSPVAIEISTARMWRETAQLDLLAGRSL